MSQKPPIDLAVWQWALIGSGGTLVLALAAYGVVAFISPNNNCVANSNSSNPNTNSSNPSRNIAESSPFDLRLPSLPNPMGSFQNQSNKARQSEAKTYTGSMNRAQQAFYLEKSKFATNVDELGIGIKTETENYSYRTVASNRATIQIGGSKRSDLKSYVGAVYLAKISGSNDITSLAILCESDRPGTSGISIPVWVNEEKMECASGTVAIQ